MFMNKKVLITAALPYVNNLPHFGHIVGCHLPADIFYRYQKAIGNDAIFVGGADEHGTANLISAQEYNMPPEVFVKKVGDIHREIYKKLGISYSLNSGTHTPEHDAITKEFFTEIYKNGYIEERETEMLYCEKDKIALADRFVIGTCPYCGYDKAYGDQCDKCGSVYDSDKLINPHCKFCGEPVVFKKTKHLFLKLDKIEPELDKWIEAHKNIWRPHVYGEAKRWIKEGLTPRAITRDIPWGINVPLKGFEDKVFYVWFDAPIGYISITKELGGDELVKDRWQNPDCEIYNFIGKDNISFHSVFFPAMTIANGKYNLAHNVVGFNFMNFDGQKFSKSKKIGVFCDALLTSDIDVDTLRAYLVTVFPENKDSDFKWEGYRDVVNADLVGKFGNFFNRCLNMIYKNFEGKLDFEFDGEIKNAIENKEYDKLSNLGLNEFDIEMIKAIQEYPNLISDLFAKTEFIKAYKEIMNFASVGNGYIEKSAPWSLIKNGDIDNAKKVLYLCLCMAKSLCICAAPIIPNRATEIWQEQLNFAGAPTDENVWAKAGKIDIEKSHQTLAPKPLFARVDDEILAKRKEEFEQTINLKDYLK